MGPTPRSRGRGRGLPARRDRRDDERRLALGGRRRQPVVAAARSSARCLRLPLPPVSASCWPDLDPHAPTQQGEEETRSARDRHRRARDRACGRARSSWSVGFSSSSRSSSRSGSCSGRRTQAQPPPPSATTVGDAAALPPSEPPPVRIAGLRLVPLRAGRLDRGRRAPRAHCPPQASGDRRAAAGGRRGARIGRSGGRGIDRPDRARPRRPSGDHPRLRADGARIRRRGDAPAAVRGAVRVSRPRAAGRAGEPSCRRAPRSAVRAGALQPARVDAETKDDAIGALREIERQLQAPPP